MDNHSRLNRIYREIKARCYNTNTPNYKKYGAIGITVCKEWLNPEHATGTNNCSVGFTEFKKWALANGYSDNLTIDRINNKKGYSPCNCRWVTQKTQQNNRTNNHLINYKGRTQTLMQWSEELGFNYCKVKQRLNKLHWSVEKAFETN